ncbi:ABC transporter permease [Pseudonocardia abyssalis]|uniref:ABC transporter permease n=1 Tax=Pseudonocardia abyssalis TaxID=2792008 RepID=A0ABS6UWU3_9PSEU|nr:ABC transporter permease [Pseudonocardia abyssalis]MBW0115992.1 ABC transporter permease [Pseudonocardia abyssalis]MBW0136744.1 ABC transporter permease [Pseudonocardia abyssalis]
MSAPLRSRQAVLLVAGREFTSQVRSRSFVIGLLVTLVLFGGIGLLGSVIAGQSSSPTLGVTPETASLRPAIEQAAATQGLDVRIVPIEDGAGRVRVDADELDALLTGSAGDYELLGRDAVEPELEAVVGTAVQQEALAAALAQTGVDPAELAQRSQVSTDTLQPVDPNRGEQLALALVGTVLLFISLSGYGQLVATGVVEEKQSRVVELLLATIKPWQLLAGKVLGLGAVGLLQLVILGIIGTVAAAVGGLLTVPGAAVGMFAMVVVWYLLGFFLFAALYAAIGSTVSRQEELNSVVTPLIFVLLIPFVLVVNLLPGDPRNELAAVLSFIPFLSQTIMPARYALGVAPLWEVGVSALIALVAVVVVVRVAGRVYENSILRTGARVSLREALGRPTKAQGVTRSSA